MPVSEKNNSRNQHHKAAQLALEQYNLALVKHRFYAQEDNILYSLYGPEKQYILKLNEQCEDSPDYQASLSWLVHLSKSIPPVSSPLKNSRGSYFTRIKTHEAEYTAVIYPWIPGKLLSSQLNLETAKNWGTLLAQIHQCSASYSPAEEDRLLIWDKAYYWEKKILHRYEFADYFPEKRRRVFKAMEINVNQGLKQLFNTPQDPMIIHGDLHPHNVKVHQKQVYALDFDDCMWGYPVQDIAIALLYIRHRDNFKELKAAFKEGYTSIQPWPEDHPGQIRLLMMGRLLWMANAVAWDVESGDESADEFEERLSNYEEEFEDFLNR